ncbi:MAG: rod shape-determining protein MreC [Dethiosulfovibrio peptidovorans]|nr:MAG: rod shape-determining protein MreC [Dethiosulfovibrio peptidovorans]
MADIRQRRIISGLCAVALGLILTLSTGSEPVLKVMSLWAQWLELMERPAVMIRHGYRSGQMWFQERRTLMEELAGLKRENDSLFLALHMKDALILRKTLMGALADARVDLRLSRSWWNEFRIDQGGLDGLSPGDPVLQEGFLIGRISRVDDHRSWVSLLTSTSEMVPVIVRETRDVGVVVGDGQGGLWLCYIPDNSDIQPGMALDTALISEFLPPGIPVGLVADGDRESDLGTKEYQVISGGSLSRIYGVRVFRKRSVRISP